MCAKQCTQCSFGVHGVEDDPLSIDVARCSISVLLLLALSVVIEIICFHWVNRAPQITKHGNPLTLSCNLKSSSSSSSTAAMFSPVCGPWSALNPSRTLCGIQSWSSPCTMMLRKACMFCEVHTSSVRPTLEPKLFCKIQRQSVKKLHLWPLFPKTVTVLTWRNSHSLSFPSVNTTFMSACTVVLPTVGVAGCRSPTRSFHAALSMWLKERFSVTMYRRTTRRK